MGGDRGADVLTGFRLQHHGVARLLLNLGPLGSRERQM